MNRPTRIGFPSSLSLDPFWVLSGVCLTTTLDYLLFPLDYFFIPILYSFYSKATAQLFFRSSQKKLVMIEGFKET
jgi:hypothetical protein